MDIYSKKKCCSFHNVQYENQSFGEGRDEGLAGYIGWDKTVAYVKDNLYWLNKHKDVGFATWPRP